MQLWEGRHNSCWICSTAQRHGVWKNDRIAVVELNIKSNFVMLKMLFVASPIIDCPHRRRTRQFECSEVKWEQISEFVQKIYLSDVICPDTKRILVSRVQISNIPWSASANVESYMYKVWCLDLCLHTLKNQAKLLRLLVVSWPWRHCSTSILDVATLGQVCV